MIETPITFRNHGQQLVGMTHTPERESRGPAVLMYHGFTASRIENHFLYVKMARRLTASGYFTMRFDFRGSGESQGRFREITIPDEVDDARVALAWLRSQPAVNPDRVILLGLSMGGAVAATIAGEDSRVAAVVLWSAVADLGGLFHQAATQEPPPPLGLQPDGSFDIGGHLLGPAFLSTIDQIRPLESIKKYQGPVLIIHGTEDPTVPPAHADLFYEAAGPEQGEQHWIQGADHTYSSHVWEEEVFRLTANWLARKVPPGQQ